MISHDLRHLDTDNPCVLVVDGSKLVRKLIATPDAWEPVTFDDVKDSPISYVPAAAMVAT